MSVPPSPTTSGALTCTGIVGRRLRPQIVMISVDSEDPDDDDVAAQASEFDVVGVHDGRSSCDDDGHEHVGIRGVLERARVGLVASLVGTDGSKGRRSPVALSLAGRRLWGSGAA